MGTKLDYAINLLAPSQNSTSFSVHCVDDLEYYLQIKGQENNFQITGLTDKYPSSMNDRMPEKHNVDFIRKTMQIQEDIFKHQVRELHRLYSVQKMLMEEVKKGIKQKKMYWSPMISSDIVNSKQLMINKQQQFNIKSLRDDQSPRESCSGERMRIIMRRGFDLERPANQEDISLPGVSDIDHDNTPAAGTTSSCVPLNLMIGNKMSSSDEESEVELTLSIGGGGSSKSKKSILDSPASFKSERGEDCSGSGSAPTTPMSSSSATFDQERKQPHWLLQSLSINRTS